MSLILKNIVKRGFPVAGEKRERHLIRMCPNMVIYVNS